MSRGPFIRWSSKLLNRVSKCIPFHIASYAIQTRLLSNMLYFFYFNIASEMSSLHFNGNSMHFETFPFRHGFILFRYCRKMGFRCSFPKLSQTFFWTQISANWNAPKCSLEFECISELVTIHFGTNTRWLHKFHKSLIYSVKRHKLKFRTSIYIMEKSRKQKLYFRKVPQAEISHLFTEIQMHSKLRYTSNQLHSHVTFF